MSMKPIRSLHGSAARLLLLCAFPYVGCGDTQADSASNAGNGGKGIAGDGTSDTAVVGSSVGGATNRGLGGASTLGGRASTAFGGVSSGFGGAVVQTGSGISTMGGAPTGGATNGTAGSIATGGKSAGGATNGTAGSIATGGKSAGGATFGGQTATGGTLSALGGKPSSISPANGATLVKPNPSVKHQRFEGWGTSMCWWANRIGSWPTDKVAKFVEQLVNPTSGLGYNIFRYNIGGGENPNHSHMGEYKDMPGFQPTRGKWNWDADARQTAVLKQIAGSGQNLILEAFSNSPPYWMTKSGCASGNTDGSNNLKDDAYELFADYLTEVVKHYRDTLGITFRTLEPMNEPNSNWWKANGGQEGCHFGASSQQQLIKAVGAQLASKGLSDTHVSASDENSMDDAHKIMSGYDASTFSYLAQMNAHSYAGTKRAELRALATSKGKRLWQSESGPLSVTLADNTAAAIFMAQRIVTDLRALEAEAWIDWQTYDASSNWTSFSINANQQTATPVKRFYMHAAFSRFIRPGATFIDIDNGNMVAAVSADRSTLAVVVVNGDRTAAKSFTFDLTRLDVVGDLVQVYRTSATEDLAHLAPIPLQNWNFTAASAPYSVTTFVIPTSR
ncbi:MAG: glycoside hydrolase [Polyangiaceae bacterium]